MPTSEPEPDRAPLADRSVALSLRIVAAVGAIAAALIAIVSSRTLYADSLHCLIAGREIWRHGLPTRDPLTFLGHGRMWTDQQWLAHLTFYGAWSLGGMRLVGALSAALVGLSLGVLAATIAARGTAPIRVGIWTIAAFAVVEVNSFIRAQSFALPLFAIALALLLRDDDQRIAGERRGADALPQGAGLPGRGVRLALLGVLVLWGNLHGSVVGFVPVVVATWSWHAVVVARRGLPRSALEHVGWAIAACIAPLITPYGLRIVGYYRDVLGSREIKAAASEWQPWTIVNPFTLVFALLVAASLLAIGVAIGRRVRISVPLLVGTTLFAGAGLEALRSQVWLAFFAAVQLGDLLTRIEAVGSEGPRIATVPFPRAMRTLAFVVPVLAVVAGSVSMATTTDAHFWRALPRAGALEAVTHDRGAEGIGNICGDEDASTTIEWLRPETRGRVAFDVRYEIYSEAQLHGIFHLLAQRHPTLPGWFATRCRTYVASKLAGHDEFVRTVRRMHLVDVRDRRDALVRETAGYS